MKISNSQPVKPAFVPFTITVETPEEAAMLVAILGPVYACDTVKRAKEYKGYYVPEQTPDLDIEVVSENAYAIFKAAKSALYGEKL